jgi:hypothetical protein
VKYSASIMRDIKHSHINYHLHTCLHKRDWRIHIVSKHSQASLLGENLIFI